MAHLPMFEENLIKQLKALSKEVIFFGPQGFELATSHNKLMTMQHGFSQSDEKNASQPVKQWPAHWLVIAKDTELGDPYFVDTKTDNSPVSTAIYDENNLTWQIEQVASSLSGFMRCLSLLIKTSKQNVAQFFPEPSTISDPETLTALHDDLTTFSQSPEFWQLFFDCYHEWLNDDDVF